MPEYQYPTVESLRETALNHLKESKQQSYKQMVKDSELDEYLDLVIENTQRFAHNLINTGVEPGEAWEQAIKNIIFESEG